MRLIAYSRVSTDDQAKAGHSLGQQPARLTAYCVAHEHELVGQVTEHDGVSASTPLEKRPGGAELLRRLAAGEADGVVVVRLDRLFRDLLDGLHFFRVTAPRHGITVHSLAEHIDTSTANGRLSLHLQLVLADHERDKTGERTREVMRGMRASGRVYGHTPFGVVAHEGQMYQHPATWPQRLRIVELRGRGLSLETLATQLREEGIAPPAGGRRWSKSVLSALVKSHSSLAHLPVLPDHLAHLAAASPEAVASPAQE